MTPDDQLAPKNQLLQYYQAELRFLRRQAVEFAARHPGVADKLKLRENQEAGDPHVERLLEGVALLAGRVRAKIDDEFPELTDAILGVLYPHLLAPVPSMAVVQFVPPPGANLVGGLPVPKHTPLFTPAVDGVSCQYRTGYPVTLWPVEVASAGLGVRPFPAAASAAAPEAAKAVLTLVLRPDGPVALEQTALGAPAPAGAAEAPLRLFLAGEPAVVLPLYEHLFNDAVRVVIRNPQTRAAVAEDADPVTRTHPWIRPVGFEPDEGLLPYPPQAFTGYRVLTEFFAYRDKFLFADLGGWAEARRAGVLAGGPVEVLVFLDRDPAALLRSQVTAATFLLGCTPVVNLFEKMAEVIPVTHRSHDYPVVPDRHHPGGYEVYSIDRVTHRDPASGREVEYGPFYSFRHRPADRRRAYWYSRRRASDRTVVRGGEEVPDPGTEVDVCFVDLGFEPTRPAADQAFVQLTCLNRDLPTRFPESLRGQVGFDARGQFGEVRCVRPPTPTLRPPPRVGSYWRLVSHLSLNHLSITDPVEGRDVLREYLRLYDYADPRAYPDLAGVNERVVSGLEEVTSRRSVEFTRGPAGAGFARGVAVDVRLDADKFVGVGAFLFAAVLDRFLALYASVNSFTQLNHYTRQRGDRPVKVWPPRTGTGPLL